MRARYCQDILENRSRLLELANATAADPTDFRPYADRARLYRAVGDERRAAHDEHMVMELLMGITLG